MLAPWPFFRTAFFGCLTLLFVFLVAGLAATDAQASKAKEHTRYWGSADASGEWQQTSDCGGTFYNYQSKWHFEALYAKAFPSLAPGGELDMSMGGASGGIDWTVDELCNGSVQSGNCSVGLGDLASIPPVGLYKAKGGLGVDFQLPIIAVGCGYAQVAAYGEGFEALNRVDNEPHGFIPSKKIGKKKITVPISGNASGTAAGRSYSGQMSGTLTLTRRPPLQDLPDF